MRKAAIIVTLLFQVTFLYADYIVTKNQMVINGKIIKKTRRYIHIKRGTGKTSQVLKIKRSFIKKIHIEPVLPVVKKDLMPDKKGEAAADSQKQSDIKTTEKKPADKEQPEKTESIVHTRTEELPLLFYASLQYRNNFGTIGEAIPHTLGVSVTTHVDLRGRLFEAQTYVLDTIAIETGYNYTKYNSNLLHGGYLTAGPVVDIYKYSYFDFFFSLQGGAGFYCIDFIDNKSSALRIQAKAAAGSKIAFRSYYFVPEVVYTYIHDPVNPVHGIGFNLGFGTHF